jgi:serine phosphatase RsbU (regulator of sigma subunit)
VCVQVDPRASTLRYSTAGHPPPLVRTPDGRVTLLDAARGAPLAAGFGPARVDQVVAVEPGSLVVLYSDGLIERRGIPIDDRLAELTAVVRAVDPGDPTGAADAIVRQLGTDEEQGDDIAVLCYVTGPVTRPDRGAGITLEGDPGQPTPIDLRDPAPVDGAEIDPR